MKKLSIYMDGKIVPSENIISVTVGENLHIMLELVYPEKKLKVCTDSGVRKIEIKYG